MLIVSVCGTFGWILSVEALRMASCRIRKLLDRYGYCLFSLNRYDEIKHEKLIII